MRYLPGRKELALKSMLSPHNWPMSELTWAGGYMKRLSFAPGALQEPEPEDVSEEATAFFASMNRHEISIH